MADAELTVARRRAADLEKREQRLMTAFKKQIYVFRESVRLLFGYKVDMSVDESAESGANACVATLRSQFTLHADDEDERHVLRFAVEPARVGGAARGAAAAHHEGSVELLATPAAETEKVRRMAETFAREVRVRAGVRWRISPWSCSTRARCGARGDYLGRARGLPRRGKTRGVNATTSCCCVCVVDE